MHIIFENLKQLFFVELGAQRLNAILLVPVFVAIGVAWYFSLLAEPFWGYGVAAISLSLAAAVFVRGYGRIAAVAVLCSSLGFGAAQLRTHMVYTPILSHKMDFTIVEGRIAAVEELEKGVRLTLSEVVMEELDAEDTPRKVRLKLWKGDGLKIGQRVSGLASLNPPSSPVIPKGFDFQRYMYFRGIGAVGFMYKPPEILQDVSGLGFSGVVETVRQRIGGRIEGVLNAPQSGLARALMIGQRTSIDEDDMESIRAAGLAHMLAISGLHVGLFSGVVFFALRFGMALFPPFALRHPVKKYAAVVAMMAALFYMLIAGATIPTQRAMISVAVVFTAVLLDRSPISLRVVAFAALCVLLVFPESLMSASFQMSFAAVTGLIAFYDWTRPLWSRWARQAGMLRKGALYFVGVSSTTITATLTTAPVTLFHFQALPSYGLIANVVCVPLLAFMVMPLAILALILMPFGLEGFAFALMEPGLSVILNLAHFVADLKGAVFRLPAFTLAPLVFFILAALSVVIFRARLRVIATSIFAVCALVNFQWIQYDVFVSSKFDVVALDAGEPQMIISDARKSRFMRENWEQAIGREGSYAERFPREGVREGDQYKLSCGDQYKLSCDAVACRYEFGGHKLSYVKRYDVRAFADECRWANIIVSQDIYKRDCAAEHVLNRRDGKYHGVHAFKLNDDGITLHRTEDFRGARPWVQKP